ncbi:MAG: hypothetical protein Q8S26_15290 [Azonexus sp.]|nr:hypothetical protein [Azonexus sp.]
MKKKVIIVASDAGNIGKTLVASVILETLRLTEKIDGYVCDRNFQGLYERYGQKNSNGALKPLHLQDPAKGVAFLDIANPDEKSKVASSLGTDSNYLLFDLPANATHQLATCMGTPQDFIDFMDFADADVTFVCPIKDQKSISSYKSLKETFPAGAKFILAINAGFIKSTESNAQSIIDSLIIQFGHEPHFILEQSLSPRIFDLLKNNTLREVFLPREERKQADGSYSPSDSAYLAQDRGDQFILNRFIPSVTKAVEELFLND